MHTERIVALKWQSVTAVEDTEERGKMYLDSRCMWPESSIGIIIKDLDVMGEGGGLL